MISSLVNEKDAVQEIIARHSISAMRLTFDEALTLYNEASLHTLAHLANAVRFYKHITPIVTYVADRNINYSNVCETGCLFCAFYRTENNPEAYVLPFSVIDQKIEETIALGGTQILLQGGHHPSLPFSFYTDMIHHIHTTFPSIHIHAFSAPEILFFAKKFAMSVETVLEKLIAVGLHSIPGAGAEILVDTVRREIAPKKCSSQEWLDVMETAHSLGLRTTATMMFGHKETRAHRIEHMFRLRELQEKTHGFTAFIPWGFQPQGTRISCYTTTAPEYLRTVAIARIILYNFDNIQASWVTMGPNIAQLSLSYGVNDFGSLMIEENVVAAAGVSFRLGREEIHSLITAAGFLPQQRTMNYTHIVADA